MTFYITPNKQQVPKHELPGFFDLSGIGMTFDFIQIKQPILSPSGKVGLKVKQKAESGKAEIAAFGYETGALPGQADLDKSSSRKRGRVTAVHIWSNGASLSIFIVS